MEDNRVDFVPVQPVKKGSGKKVGFFFLSLTPPIACVALQIILGGIYMVIAAVISMIGFQAANPAATQQEVMDVYINSVYNAASGGVMIYHLLSIPIFGLWYYFGCNRPKMKQSVKNLSWKAVVIGVVGGVLLCLLSNGIVGIEQYIIPGAVEQFIELMETVGMGSDLLAIIAAVVLAPIGEELVCRGLTLHFAKKALPHFWMANVLQALMFGVIHMNLIQGVYAFAIGLFLGYLAERYHSLLPCVLVHFVINFSTTVWIDKVFYWVPDSLVSYSILFAISLIVIIGLVWWGGPIIKKKQEV